MNNDLNTVTTLTRLPLQVAPVDRTPAGAALLAASGVDASFDWGSLVSAALPILSSIF
jgi:hypothetical protein